MMSDLALVQLGSLSQDQQTLLVTVKSKMPKQRLGVERWWLL